MQFPHLMSLPVINRLPKTISLTSFMYNKFEFKQTQSLSISQPISYKVFLLRNVHLSFGICFNSARLHHSHDMDVKQEIVMKVADDCSYDFTEEDNVVNDSKEIERRRKIGMANKGKVPWNKGKKHSAESLERISQRTKEAMANPKVRKKISESPRAPHSYHTKVKLRSSLRKVWQKRLKEKRSKEKILDLWSESISSAAKIGGKDQTELEWDSYDKLKEQIALELHQRAEDQIKAKEMAKLQARFRAERATRSKEERISKLARKEKEQENKVEAIKIKSFKNSGEFPVNQEVKLKERLTKIHKKKSTNGKISNQDYRPWEKLNLDCVKKEDGHRDISLADQIQAAKSRRMEHMSMKRPTISSFTPKSRSR
ncbi:uncharacterized protein LOC124938531 [Impatiens glandulifera]|uniref:uncharacterized protein LOC124938531 n=1 Tax=Impatiens glandulifera TaxID=253017 RepID=UPI001FB0C69C|nr:uncharacterized protein LOC124938531 [Impatiens glandulifera]